MPSRSDAALTEIRDVLVETYAINDAMNQLLLVHGRTIAAIFAHLHNNRLTWLKHSAPHLKCPAPSIPTAAP
jgi:hypothetical protein